MLGVFGKLKRKGGLSSNLTPTLRRVVAEIQAPGDKSGLEPGIMLLPAARLGPCEWFKPAVRRSPGRVGREKSKLQGLSKKAVDRVLVFQKNEKSAAWAAPREKKGISLAK